jgi:hypothetical protein
LRLRVAHRTAGRTRLRAAVRPVEVEALAGFAERLAELPGVDAVDCRFDTGSIVVEHPDMEGDRLIAEATRLGGVFDAEGAVGEARHDGLASVRSALGSVDGMLGQLSTGGIDLRTISFVLMLGLALRQITRGNIMVPAMSFLWYAFEILAKSAHAKEAHGEGAPLE